MISRGDTFVYGDVTGASGPEMAIKINNVANLTAADSCSGVHPLETGKGDLRSMVERAAG